MMTGGGLGEYERASAAMPEEERGALVGAVVLVGLGELIPPKSVLMRSVDIEAMAARKDSSPGSTV